YTTGRGKIIIRAKANIETLKTGKENIVITELPYQVNKANLIEKIAELVREGKLDDISDIRDESDRDGLRIVIELKRDAQAEVVLNQLYKHTNMQMTFGVIMLALVNGVPTVLTLKQMMQHFIDHRHEVLVRRTKFDLDAAERRAHILEGYKIALDNIDEIVQLIKKSKDVETAKNGLMRKFKLSEIQAKAILDMRLQRLTGLERKKIEDEYRETIKLIEKLRFILANKAKRMQIISEELLELKEKYGDERRTMVIKDYSEFSIEDIIAEEDVVITISHNGYIKRFPVSGYKRQSRGGKGVTGAATRDDDFIEHMFIASTHNYILLFTDQGKCHWLKVYEIPEGGRASRGRSILNLVQLDKGDSIRAYVSVREFDSNRFVVMVTEKGLIKKTRLDAFSNPRKSGIIAINLNEGDRLIDAKISDGADDIIIGTREGMAIRFNEQDVRDMGRNATGVKAINLDKNDRVVGMVVSKRKSTILVVTENGYGKRTEIDEYRITRRGGKGVKTLKTSDKNGKMVDIKEIDDNDDIVIITEKGMIIRQHAKDLRVMGRNTQGVKLIKLNPADRISAITRVVPEDEDEE
ncbi:MAG: DNA gyrase C-terminal beta-propeller domain-containing protein, partial [Ignavibacteria bacterium]